MRPFRCAITHGAFGFRFLTKVSTFKCGPMPLATFAQKDAAFSKEHDVTFDSRPGRAWAKQVSNILAENGINENEHKGLMQEMSSSLRLLPREAATAALLILYLKRRKLDPFSTAELILTLNMTPARCLERCALKCQRFHPAVVPGSVFYSPMRGKVVSILGFAMLQGLSPSEFDLLVCRDIVGNEKAVRRLIGNAFQANVFSVAFVSLLSHLRIAASN